MAHTIVIVGGVAGGASAAARARRMNENARIIMLEKDEHVSFANCGLPYYIGGEIQDRDKLLVATPQKFDAWFNIDVRTRSEVLNIDRRQKSVEVRDHAKGETYQLAYDKLILAPGANPIKPPLDGVDAPNVHTLRNLADTDAIKADVDRKPDGRAVVVGAGYIGLEMVEMLKERGMDVALVELMDQVMPIMDAEMAQVIQQELEQHDVEVHLGDGLAGFELDGKQVRRVVLNSGARLDADLVVLGIGVRPNTRLAEDAGLELGSMKGIQVNRYCQTSAPDIYAVGDAAEYPFGPTGETMRIPLAGPANRAGRLAGEHAATGDARPMADVYGTAIVRVFAQAAATTGLTVKLADRLGVDARSVTVVAPSHAGYYPGAEPITLKLIYAPDDGRVLGAQAVGRDGVDKRIDVIATAMAMGASVHDLTGLDLAYAPPFGSAKDPVHMAAFAAANDIDGVIHFIPPDADLADLQVLDVRTAAEIEKQPIPHAPHARHIPLPELRDRIGELDPDRPTVTVCASGMRSYLAGRILMQHGFKQVCDLTGGVTVRRRATAAGEQQPA